jgi:PAS domain S-box-containing protein
VNTIELVTSILVLTGALFMGAAILRGRKIGRHVPPALQQRWRVMVVLMLFFLAGYLSLIVVLTSSVALPTEVISGPVFLAGAVFVFIVISLTRETVSRIKSTEEDLRLLNESLEQRVAERTQELQRSHEFLRTVLDSLNDQVIIIDVYDFKIVGANTSFLAAYGLKQDEVIGRTCHEITHHRADVCTPPNDICPLLETVKTNRLAAVEHVHYLKTGKATHEEISTLPIKDNKGTIVQVVHVSRDISERKRAEQALQESEKKYRMLFEGAGDAIFILEAEGADVGKIVAVNKTAAEMHGYEIDELMHKNIRVFDSPESASLAAPLIRRILGGEWVKGFEITHRRKNGEVFPVEINAGLLELGDHKYILGFDRDITERKNAEKKLEQYAADLKQSNQDVLSFAYIVSHDLRAPLVSIKGFTGELQLALKEIEAALDVCMSHLGEQERPRMAEVIRVDVPEAMKFIGSSVSRMDGLINAILMLSRAGHRELKPELIDMKELTNSILSSLAHQIERSKTSVLVEELPVITADKVAMEQIMGNLLDNALKYLDPVREGQLAITAEHTSEEIVFHIIDNGRGIAQEDMHKVFEIFRRAGKQDVPGEGMGLAYVKTLVRKQGGRIWCESDLGKGTTFSFTIPWNESAQDD